MDDRKRVEELKEEVHRISGGKAVMGGIENLPPAVAVKFLERVIASPAGGGTSKVPPPAVPTS
jgi:hypothetical protein